MVMHSIFLLELDATTEELDATTDEELASISLLELSMASELLSGCSSRELLEMGCISSLLDSRTPLQLLEEGTLQLQGAALGLSLSQATSANARSDTAESPHAMLVILFFMIPLLFAPKP